MQNVEEIGRRIDAAAAEGWAAREALRSADPRGMYMGPGHVAPATIEGARAEALAEDRYRSLGLDRRAILNHEPPHA